MGECTFIAASLRCLDAKEFRPLSSKQMDLALRTIPRILRQAGSKSALQIQKIDVSIV
jgi:hypothetical protein